VTGEWDQNRLLQVVVVLYCFFVFLLWLTNWMLYFDSMDFTTASVVEHYLGNEAEFRTARTYRGMLEVAHFHLFAMGMLMMVLTHLALFVPVRTEIKIMLIVVPFFSAIASEGAGWLVRFGGAGFAWTKIAGILLLQGSLAMLVGIALWSVFAGNQAENYAGGSAGDVDLDDEDWD
jgi:hypothetical protein